MSELQMWQQNLLSIKEMDTRAITAIVEALVETPNKLLLKLKRTMKRCWKRHTYILGQ